MTQPQMRDDTGKSKGTVVAPFVASEERFRLLTESVKDYGIFMLDPEGYIQTWNEGARRIKGYEASEIVGKHFSTFYTQTDLDDGKPARELFIATKEGKYEEEGWRVRKDGTTFWANVVITALRDSNGVIKGFGKVTRDLTTRKEAEDLLRESEERYRLIVSSVKDYAIIMLDPEGRVVSWNEGAYRLKGYTAQEIIGQKFTKFYEPEDIEAGKCDWELREAIATGRFEDEGWRLRKDGSRFWANVVITALRSDKGELRGFAKVTRDVTEKKRSEDRLRFAHESLEIRVANRTRELEKAIESRDEFLSIASHELRTPLTALKLQQQILERQMKRAKDGLVPVELFQDMIELTGRQVDQLTNLVDDMLDVSRIANGQMSYSFEECDLVKLVGDHFRSFKHQFEANGIKSTFHSDSEVKARVDLHRLGQVVANLLSNAMKYGEGAPVEVSVFRAGSEALITVHDNGPGVADANQSRIFERFERAVSASEASGLGLGLYISRQIAEAHGGRVDLVSAVGEGSTFTIRIPI
ncbi:MAG: PAS domain-containing sensor histidine kinase [Bdellovibrionota bacterium]